MSRLLHWLFTLTFAFVAGSGVCQYQVEFARLGVNEGLSQNSVYAIHQDEKGFLWIGTGDGLNRFDGKSFLTYRERFGDTSLSYLPGRMILGKIIRDSTHRLWFKTNQGLVCFDKQKNLFLKPSRFNQQFKSWENKVDVIGVDNKNNVWLKAATYFICMNPQTWTFKVVSPSPNFQIIRDVVFTNNNIYFLMDQGLYVLSTLSHAIEMKKRFAEARQINLISPSKIAISGRSKIWTVSLPEWKEEEIEIKLSRADSLFRSFDVVCEYPRQVYYLRVASQGLLRYNHVSGDLAFFQHEPLNSSSLSNNFITTSFIDGSYNLWIGTEGGGLSRLDLKPQKFKSFPAYNLNARQAANLMVKSISKAGDKVLVGTFHQGLYVIQPSKNVFQQYQVPRLLNSGPIAGINVIYQDQRGRFWMNVGNQIGILDTASFRVKNPVGLPPVEGHTEFGCWVYSMLEISPDNYLLGTLFGLHRMQLKNGKVHAFRMPGDSLLNGHIQALQKAPDGSIYVGKIGNGFWRIRATEKGIDVLDKGFLNTGIRHFYFDKKSPIVWMASENGLIAYNSKTKNYSVFDETNGMSNGYVYSIVPENDTTFWLSTNKGLNKAEIRYSEKDGKPQVSFIAYTQIDGLQSNEFNTGAHFQSADGEMFFGGVNGINWFKPGQIIANRFKPYVVLTNLSVNEKPYNADRAIPYLDKISLPYDQNTLSFRFASLEYSNASANLYAYQLEGFDKDWIYSGGTNEARYANLPPGQYRFKVKGSNSDGVWGDQMLMLPVSIQPPYWQTNWFRIAVALLAVLLIGAGIRFYVSLRVRNRLKELEKQKAVNEERIRISKDMHDELGTGLTKITLLSEVSRQGMLKMKSELPLQEIASTSRQLTQKMGEIIWTLNPKNDTLDNLAAYLKEQIYELSETAALDVRILFPTEIPQHPVSNLQRQQILLVTKEAFHNIVKHAQATEAILRMELNKNYVQFALQDNGKGFHYTNHVASVNGRKNGLSNMAWRIEQVGGTINIRSKPGEGTEIIFGIPINQ